MCILTNAVQIYQTELGEKKRESDIDSQKIPGAWFQDPWRNDPNQVDKAKPWVIFVGKVKNCQTN